MDLGISGKTAIVCASSKGLGLGCALALAEEGAHVVLNGRNADSLAAAQAAVEAAISAGSGSVTAVAADVTTPENRAKAFGLIGVAFGLGFALGPGLTIIHKGPGKCDTLPGGL